MRETTQPQGLSTLASRIQWIIEQTQIRQVDFAKSLGISANYVYLLTSGRKTAISEPLSKLIESTYGYASEWILTGQSPKSHESIPCDLQRDTIEKVKRMDDAQLRAVAAFIRSLRT